MDRAREDLLADARLPLDQHGSIDVCEQPGFLNRQAQRRARADDLVETITDGIPGVVNTRRPQP
jgi:hypothetical protein